MPPRPKNPATSLSEDDLIRLRTALEEGKRPTVYLRDAVPSLGVDEASSARVMSVSGSTVTVRPKGVGDEVPFEAGELYSTRAAATQAAAEATAVMAAKKPRVPRAAAPRPRLPVPARPATAPETVPTPTRLPAVRRSASEPRITVTLSGTASGGWTVQGAQGTRKLSAPAPVTVEAVAQAVEALGDETVRTAVLVVLDAARMAAQERVVALSAELSCAQAELEALNGQR